MDWIRWLDEYRRRLNLTPHDFTTDYWLHLFEADASYSTPLLPDVHRPLDVLERLVTDVPDWKLEVATLFTRDSGAAFEWVASGHRMVSLGFELHGCTVIEVSTRNRIVRWVDYVDRSKWDGVVKVGG